MQLHQQYNEEKKERKKERSDYHSANNRNCTCSTWSAPMQKGSRRFGTLTESVHKQSTVVD